MEEKREIKFTCHCVKWNDKNNGNTYFSCRVYRNEDSEILYIPFQYGYDDTYRDITIDKMVDQNWISQIYKEQPWMYERENNYPIHWIVTEGLKTECKRHGK